MQFSASALLVALFCTVTFAAPLPQVQVANQVGNTLGQNNGLGGNVVLNSAQIDALDATGRGAVIAPGQAAIAQGANAQLIGAQRGANDNDAQLAALAAQVSAVNANFGVASEASQKSLFDSLNRE